MKVFLTGATGYVGCVVGERLKHAGHVVRGLVRAQTDAGAVRAKGIDPCVGDLLDVDLLRKEACQADAVIHAGFPKMPNFTQALEEDRRIAHGFIDALAGSGKALIYTSGGALTVDRAVGERSDRLVDETVPLDPPPAFAPRAAAEREVLAAKNRRVRSIVLRLASVYGRGGSAFIPMLLGMARQSGMTGYIGRGENIWSHVHVDDVAYAYVRALERAPVGSLFNVAGEELSMRRLAEAVGQATGARIVSWTVEEAAKVFGPFAGPMAANARLSSEKAKRELGWSPTGPSVIQEIEQGSYAAAPTVRT